MLLHQVAVVGINVQRAIGRVGAEIHQLIARQHIRIGALAAVVAVEILHGVFVAALADELAVKAAGSGSIARFALRIEISHDLLFDDIKAAVVVLIAAAGFVEADRNIDGSAQADMVADAGAHTQPHRHAGRADRAGAQQQNQGARGEERFHEGSFVIQNKRVGKQMF